jgi:hypothetical protein
MYQAGQESLKPWKKLRFLELDENVVSRLLRKKGAKT